MVEVSLLVSGISEERVVVALNGSMGGGECRRRCRNGLVAPVGKL